MIRFVLPRCKMFLVVKPDICHLSLGFQWTLNLLRTSFEQMVHLRVLAGKPSSQQKTLSIVGNNLTLAIALRMTNTGKVAIWKQGQGSNINRTFTLKVVELHSRRHWWARRFLLLLAFTFAQAHDILSKIGQTVLFHLSLADKSSPVTWRGSTQSHFSRMACLSARLRQTFRSYFSALEGAPSSKSAGKYCLEKVEPGNATFLFTKYAVKACLCICFRAMSWKI